MTRSTRIKSLARKVRKLYAESFLDLSRKVPGEYKRIYHIHIRKSAGSSINNLFYSKGNTSLKEIYREPIYIKNGHVYVQHNKELIEKGSYYYASSHFPLWDLHLPQGTFTFTVLRDPVERLISLYKYYCWVAQVDPNEGMKSDPSYQTLIKQQRLLNRPFREFIGELSNKYLHAQLYTFDELLNVEHALQRLAMVNQVYFFEGINAAIQDLTSCFKLRVEQLTKERHFKQVSYHISQEDRVFAKEILKDEILFYQRARKAYTS